MVNINGLDYTVDLSVDASFGIPPVGLDENTANSYPDYTDFPKPQDWYVYGTVKWFNRVRGFGFIERSEANGETKAYFVHFSQIITPYEYRCLVEGERVAFIPSRNDKGDIATHILPFNAVFFDGPETNQM